MKRITIAILIMLCLISYAFAESRNSSSQVRDPSGKLLYTTKTMGDRTEVRDPSGRLIETRKKSGNRIEVRSPSGKLLRSIKNTE